MKVGNSDDEAGGLIDESVGLHNSGPEKHLTLLDTSRLSSSSLI